MPFCPTGAFHRDPVLSARRGPAADRGGVTCARRPSARCWLAGIDHAAIERELAEAHRLDVVEGDSTVYDVYTADEAFLTSTTYCILPVSRLNGAAIGSQTRDRSRNS
jgi:branched-subunit amino acid aminotransferase/4-amino-4-deoxychorismate lyase